MKREIVVCLSVGIENGKCKTCTNLFMESRSCDDSTLDYVIVERGESRHDLFIQSRTMLRVASLYRSIVRFAKHVPCLAESFHENVNAGGRRSAFCFRKAVRFGRRSLHFTCACLISFHPVDAYDRSVLSIRSARSTSAKISFIGRRV